MNETEAGEPTPQTCLQVARQAAELAVAAADEAMNAVCRSRSGNTARPEKVMHTAHREAVEAERHTALAEEEAADPPARVRVLNYRAREAVDRAARAQTAAGVEVTATALRAELERRLTPQEHAERESARRREEAQQEAEERAATGMNSDNRRLAARNGYLAADAVPLLGWTAGHVRVLEAADTGRLYWRDGQARQAAERGVWDSGRKVHRERTQALHAAGFLATVPDGAARVLTPSPMGQAALALARLNQAGLYDNDQAAYEARFARVAKWHQRSDDKKAAARRLPPLDSSALRLYRRPVTLAEQEVRAEYEAAERWADEGGYCPGVETPHPTAEEDTVRCPCCGLRKVTMAGVLAPHKATRAAADDGPGSGLCPSAKRPRPAEPWVEDAPAAAAAVRAEQPLLQRLFAPRAAREQLPAYDLHAVIRRPQRILTPEENEVVRRTALLNLQGALIMGIVDPVPNASPMPEEAGAWVREHVWPAHFHAIERKYPWGFARWAMCERGTCWNCLSGRHDLCVHRQKGGPDVDGNRDWMHSQDGRCVAPLILRPGGEPCVWWCRCDCPKDGAAPTRATAKTTPAPADPPAPPESAAAPAAPHARAPEEGALQAVLW
ncbi:DUF6248 family natural product biosynthesis protein [Streptomyces sp. 900105245]